MSFIRSARTPSPIGTLRDLSVSSVTLAELAAGGRERQSIEEDLAEFFVLGLDAEAAFRAGLAFRQFHPGKTEQQPVLPDFLIRAQAAVLGWKHLTNDRRRRRVFPDVEFLFP